MTTAVVPKPGITFETWRAPLPTPLPRMDVAAFVGFAASGPLDVPVPVESINEFHEIFGEDLVLGIERNGNAVVYAELPPAVRQFFRAGGRRCWVVRVAANPTANRFPVPGILANAADSPATAPRAAHLIARSPGSWSDALLVNCTLRTRAIQVQWSPPETRRRSRSRRRRAATCSWSCQRLGEAWSDSSPCRCGHAPQNVAQPRRQSPSGSTAPRGSGGRLKR